MNTYAVNDVFYSLQGEGERFGLPCVFVRLAGCNLACDFCDTEFASGTKRTAAGILEWAQYVAFEHCRQVIFTGGEPLLQLDAELCAMFKKDGWFIAIETNGTKELPDDCHVDYVSCSPKGAEHTLRLQRADELRYVRGYGQGIPKPAIQGVLARFISPRFDSGKLHRDTLDWCVQLVKENPGWRLSLQNHQLLNIA